LNDHDQPHLPPPSLWPIGFAAGIACILLGLVLGSIVVAAVGAVIAVGFGFLWIRDVTKPVRTPAPAVEPEARQARTVTSPPPAADEDATYPRSTFLSAATLGLGGVIGGIITVPVLGFAVLPAFTNQKGQNVDLGPIANFPESEFVIATYLEDPEVGEVTRRTMFIRYNGQLEGKPSFTALYSRCAHLGCPVQPNGPVEDAQKKTYGDHVELIPVLAVGFGCPCHGGQYDTEGNRVAGPPVRALDRAEFSIRDGNLFLGSFYSVAKVEGAGARARIKKYGRAVPGVHVDGASAWLYPLEVPK
jgi:Rieske Fe-S protein